MAWSSGSGWSRSEGWNAAASGGGGGGGVTLDPANTGGGGTLSSDKLSLTYSSAAASSRSTTSHTSGKFYFETTFGPSMSAGFSEGGLANASQSMSSGQLGGSGNSGGAGFGDTIFYIGGNPAPGGGTVSASGITAGAVLGLAVDLSAGRIWGTTNGTVWNLGGTADPAAGLGYYDLSALSGTGALFAAVHVEANSNSVMTINFGPTYVYTKPTGFSDW